MANAAISQMAHFGNCWRVGWPSPFGVFFWDEPEPSRRAKGFFGRVPFGEPCGVRPELGGGGGGGSAFMAPC
jgi:hypothetical protein